MYTGLSEAGELPGGTVGITDAVNITSKAKKDLDEGKKWDGDIEIAENLKLKLYKKGLKLITRKM